MEKDWILVSLSSDLVKLIDKNRDDLKRWKFIELCTYEFLNSISCDDELESENRIFVQISEETVKLIDENRGESCRWKFIENCVNKYIENPTKNNIVFNTKKSKIAWKEKYDLMWTCAVLFYGLGDVISSYLAYGKPLIVEKNPILFGIAESPFIFILFKIVIIGILFLISYYYLKNKFISLFIPAILIVIGILVSINNFLYYI